MSVQVQVNANESPRCLVGTVVERLGNEGAHAVIRLSCEGSDVEIHLGVRCAHDVELLRELVERADEITALGRKELEGVDLLAERRRVEELDSERRDNRRWADCIRGTER